MAAKRANRPTFGTAGPIRPRHLSALWGTLCAALLLAACRPADGEAITPTPTAVPTAGPTATPTLLPLLSLGPTSTPTAAPSTRESPDQASGERQRIAYRQGGTALSAGDLWVMDADGSNAAQLTAEGNVGRVVGWSPDNSRIAITLLEAERARETIAVLDLRSGALVELGEMSPEQSTLCWYDAQTLAYLFEDRIELRASADGSLERTLQLPLRFVPTNERCALSPDRAWFAFDAPSEEVEGGADLYLYRLGDGGSVRLTQDGATHFGTWRGSRVVFHTFGQNKAIWEMRADGSQRQHSVDLESWFVTSMDASADGGVLVYEVEDREACCGAIRSKVYVYDTALKRAWAVYSFSQGTSAADLSVSSDGRYASFVLNGVREPPLIVVPTQGGAAERACEAACYYPRWSR